MKLRLFDVSQYIYGGVSNETIDNGLECVNGIYCTRSMPCAGLTNLLNTYIQFANKDTELVYCVDSPPTYKRELHEKIFPLLDGYKGGRPKKPAHVSVQCRMVTDVLEQIGLTYVKVEGYEADDLIASIVSQYKGDYDEIVIHSKDSDLFYLVSSSVSIEPVMRAGKHITMDNWETNVKTGYTTPYNVLTLDKLSRGERVDNIPAVDKDIMEKIYDAIPDSLIARCGDNEYLREVIRNASSNDVVTMTIFDLLVPRIIEEDLLKYQPEFKQLVFDAYAVQLQCRGYKHRLPIVNAEVQNTIDKYLQEYLNLIG